MLQTKSTHQHLSSSEAPKTQQIVVADIEKNQQAFLWHQTGILALTIIQQTWFLRKSFCSCIMYNFLIKPRNYRYNKINDSLMKQSLRQELPTTQWHNSKELTVCLIIIVYCCLQLSTAIKYIIGISNEPPKVNCPLVYMLSLLFNKYCLLVLFINRFY